MKVSKYTAKGYFHNLSVCVFLHRADVFCLLNEKAFKRAEIQYDVNKLLGK